MKIFDKLGIKLTEWVSCAEDDYDQIVWSAGAKCTKEEWDAAKTALAAEYNAQAYARSRATEYPSMQEQLDLQYWDKVNSTDKWGEAVKAVKDKYPKG